MREKLILEDFGFSITLYDPAIREYQGREFLDVHWYQLRCEILKHLMRRLEWTGQHLAFIRRFIGIKQHRAAELAGVCETKYIEIEASSEKVPLELDKLIEDFRLRVSDHAIEKLGTGEHLAPAPSFWFD